MQLQTEQVKSSTGTTVSDYKEKENLTMEQKEELSQLEETIGKNLKSYFKVGEALTTIRDKDLYKSGYKTFDDYCRERWGIGRMYAYDYIRAFDVVSNLRACNCKQLPENEAQTRPLRKLEKEKQAEVWDKAVETAKNGKITARHVSNCVSKVNGKSESKPTETKTIQSRIIELLEQIQPEDRDEACRLINDWFEENTD